MIGEVFRTVRRDALAGIACRAALKAVSLGQQTAEADILKCYRLEGKAPVECTVEEFGLWFTSADRCVALTDTQLHSVSTVFLGLDHSFLGKGPPILFETMVFERADLVRQDNPVHEDLAQRLVDYVEALDIMRRYATWSDAEMGHARVVAEVLRAEMAGADALGAVVNRHA